MPIVSKLPGHTKVATMGRYAQLAADPIGAVTPVDTARGIVHWASCSVSTGILPEA